MAARDSWRYLFANVAVYAGFAAWCLLSPAQTSQAAGYVVLDNSGRGEYLVVYCGLQFGLAAFFTWTALDPGRRRMGLQLALMTYAPIVLFRLVAIAMYWPAHGATWAIAAMELTFLI